MCKRYILKKTIYLPRQDGFVYILLFPEKAGSYSRFHQKKEHFRAPLSSEFRASVVGSTWQGPEEIRWKTEEASSEKFFIFHLRKESFYKKSTEEKKKNFFQSFLSPEKKTAKKKYKT